MKNSGGFTLVEVTLALGVAGFGLLAIFGLIPVGINLNKTSIEQAAAMNLSAALIADAQTTPTGQTASVRYGIPLPTSASPVQRKQMVIYFSDSGEPVASAAAARYLGVVSLTGPELNRSEPTALHILITWPAQSNAGLSTAPTTNATDIRANLKNFTGTAETIAALNRN